MTGPALTRLRRALEDHGCRVRGSSAQCPAHDDRQASLSIGQGNAGAVLKCHAGNGCATDDILEALSLSAADLLDEPRARNGRGYEVTATYCYTDEAGVPQFYAERRTPKDFRQYHVVNGRKVWNLSGVRRVLYQLPKVTAAVAAGQAVWIAEGEKDVLALEAAGVTATCNPMGAGKWRDEYAGPLAGADVVIVADRDDAGRAHAAAVARSLAGKAASVRVVEAAEGKDAADHLAAGHGLDEFAVSTPRAVVAHQHTPPPWADDQDILARLLRDLRVCGLVGEDRNARLAYLAVASQILDDPVSLAMKGLSSSGKSFTIETVLRFFPEDALIVMTAMAERALIYMEDEFAHKTLVLFEATALREEREKTDSNLTAYLVRSLLSEGRIRYPVPVREGNHTVTRWIEKQGPTNMIVTTTAVSLHGENETRMLSLPADDSEHQTRAVLLALADGHRAAPDFAAWHAYHRWLAGACHAVTIPYARYLAEAVPPVAVRLRRDFRAVLRLIETHAIMHQRTRKTDDHGRIIATEADYLAVRGLVADLIADAVGATVLPATRETVAAVETLSNTRAEGVTVHDVGRLLGIERSRAQRRLKVAKDRGYLKNLEDKAFKPARYLPDEPLPGEVTILPDRVCAAQCPQPCTAYCQGTAGQAGVCGCAPTARGVDGAPDEWHRAMTHLYDD
jgi:hypothetical protein